MILDERSYAIHPQYVKDYLTIYEAEGMALQVSFLGDLVGWFTTDVGTVNEVVHIWRYEDLGDRERRRAAMEASPEWQVFRKKTSHFVQSMRSRILRPTWFSPMR
ncbi:NIPSNAP family protein [Sinirhodobacter populi]|uniref:NIPSNAP family protein n=1 Tax=Paenirhodobacter populi TaxID=2306993 RepID=A0A443K4K3_9RHOB|nr:NIPSNAP family protein [Sinirhodobacter populi]RWR27717.1 NIPSNAP family protein [Sinirhodobacter populi]RWR34605.1 NIPSNAP family protein [Sinirhodobacter populi]